MTSTQRYLANDRNALVGAALAASSVATIENAVLEKPLARGGSARVALSGAYIGHEEATYEIEITDNSVTTPLISQPIFAGAGTGAISAISFTGTAQEFTVKLADLGQVLTAAGTDMEGVAIEARTPGANGNLIHLSLDLSGLSYADTNFSLIKQLAAGSDGIAGPEYDWDTKVMGADGLIPANAHRLVFGEDTSVIYRQYKVYQDGKWLYHFEPQLRRDIPQGTPIRFVSGSRSATLTDGTTTEHYTGIVTLYDLLSKLQTTSALVKVIGVVANDLSPNGMAARDLTTRTDAHCFPPSGNGSQYADSALVNYAALAGASTELVEVRCWANSAKQHPSAGIGKELWQVNGSVSGLVETLLQTGQDFTWSDKFRFGIRPRLPDGFGVPRGRFSVTNTNYQPRDIALNEIEPPICVASLALGPEAVDQTVTLTYKKRPNTGDCACSGMYAPDLSGRRCLVGTLFTTTGGTMDPAHLMRATRLAIWYRDFIKSNTAIGSDPAAAIDAIGVALDIELAGKTLDTLSAGLDDIYISGTLLSPAWVTATVYAEGDAIAAGNYRYAAKIAGTSGATAPTWPATEGATVTDGTVTWENMGLTPAAMWDAAFADMKTELDILVGMTETQSTSTSATTLNPPVGATDLKSLIYGQTVAIGTVVYSSIAGSAYATLTTALTCGSVAPFIRAGDGYTAPTIGAPCSVSEIISGVETVLASATYNGEMTYTTSTSTTAGDYANLRDYQDQFNARYTAIMDAVRAAAGILKKADASALPGDGCWRDLGAAYWWEVTGSAGGAYAPAFTNNPYFSCRDAGKGYFSTHEFAFQINIKCEASLKDGDSVTLSIGDAGWPSTYQVGDTLYLPVIAAQDLYLAGGKDGDNIQTWHVDGSVTGAFPAYALDLDTPLPYNAAGLQFSLAAGGIPFEAGDLFKFTVEGGHYKWRKDGGAWSAIADVGAGSPAISDGLSATFTTGAAPSFAAGDLYRFRALQPAALSNVVNPDVESWKWSGSGATLTANLGSVKTIDCASLAFHALPSGASVTLSGGMDGITWDWSEPLTWRAGVMAKLFADKTASWLKLEITGASGGSIGWAWAGQALATEHSAECQLRRDYALERSAGLNPSASFLGATRSGDIEWMQGILKDADMTGLLAMLDHLKSNDDEPMIVIPQRTRPEEAYPVRVVLDEIDIPEDGGYQSNTGNERRYGMKLSVKGVVA